MGIENSWEVQPHRPELTPVFSHPDNFTPVTHREMVPPYDELKALVECLTIALARAREERDRALEAQEAAEEEARIDPLTELMNRKGLKEYIEHIADREDGSVYAFVFLDLDKFKEVNDTLGHPLGDDSLRLIAYFLEEQVRKEDVCIRYGGDELMVIARLGDGRDEEETMQSLHTWVEVMVERLREEIQRYADLILEIPDFGVSVGSIVVTADSSMTAKSMQMAIEELDARMYQDKKERKADALMQGHGSDLPPHYHGGNDTL